MSSYSHVSKVPGSYKDFGILRLFGNMFPGPATPYENFWGWNNGIPTPDFQQFNVLALQVPQIGPGVLSDTIKFPLSEARCLKISNSAKRYDHSKARGDFVAKHAPAGCF